MNLGLHPQNESSLQAVAETLLGPAPAPDTLTGGYDGLVGPGVYLQVSEARPQRCDPVVTDLGVDYTSEFFPVRRRAAAVRP